MSQIVTIIQVVKATQRIPVDSRCTFFSRYDLWMHDAVLDNKLCERCLDYETTPRYLGNELRTKFPHLVILDANTIGGPEPNGDGLHHPHCRCRLLRVVEWTMDDVQWFVEYVPRDAS